MCWYERAYGSEEYNDGCYETPTEDGYRPSMFLDPFEDFNYGLYIFSKSSNSPLSSSGLPENDKELPAYD